MARRQALHVEGRQVHVGLEHREGQRGASARIPASCGGTTSRKSPPTAITR
jgi:hypothetical protein